MNIFSYSYNKILALSRKKHATSFLGFLSFIEAIFLPFPPDILLMTMILADKNKWLRYTNITLLTSVLGGIAGYYIGHYFLDFVFDYIIQFGYEDSYTQVQDWFIIWGFWVVFLAGFTPVPYKIFTIASGAFHLNIFVFIFASLISRGARFYLLSYTIFKYEEKFTRVFIKYMDLVGWLIVTFAVIAYLIWR